MIFLTKLLENENHFYPVAKLGLSIQNYKVLYIHVTFNEHFAFSGPKNHNGRSNYFAIQTGGDL